MREFDFARFLNEQGSISSKDKAVRSRVAKAKKVERDLGVNLDEIVKSDDHTYAVLM
ncbi:hypothetical protein ACFSTA_08560 [Ornithinibacillus salinisoli]|uniref:Uncharacterized protein n=1 Tax=Ornithinibacillus salinisoli TaxID=1848459 RepID=A0ABW4VZR3_9BACI